jgi:hypothetical protein
MRTAYYDPAKKMMFCSDGLGRDRVFQSNGLGKDKG